MLDKIGTFLGLASKPDALKAQAGDGGERSFASFVEGEDVEAGSPVPDAVGVAQASQAGEEEMNPDLEGLRPEDLEPEMANEVVGEDSDEFGYAISNPHQSITPPEAAAGEVGFAAKRVGGDKSSALSASHLEASNSAILRAPVARGLTGEAAQHGQPSASPAVAKTDMQHALSVLGPAEEGPARPRQTRSSPAVEGAIRPGVTGLSQSEVSKPMATIEGGSAALAKAELPAMAEGQSSEFAVQRAILRAEKRAQIAGFDAGPATRAAVAQIEPGVVGRIAKVGPRQELRAAELRTASVPEMASDVAKVATTGTIAPAATVTVPSAQASIAATDLARAGSMVGVAHPSILDIAEEAETLELAVSGSSAELRASQAAGPLPVMGRGDAAAVVRQVIDAMPRGAAGTVEVRLSPEELGTVRMQLTQSDAGLMVHIQADRPETLDLLRRHADQLARDLAQSGHDAAGFTFSGNGGEPADRDSERPTLPASDLTTTVGDDEENESGNDAGVVATGANGLDIKI